MEGLLFCGSRISLAIEHIYPTSSLLQVNVKYFKIRSGFREILEIDLGFTWLNIQILWEDIDAKVRESLRNWSGHAGSHARRVLRFFLPFLELLT